jgi:hypothetical protein
MTTSDEWGFTNPYEDVGGEVAIVGVGEAEHTRASGRTTHEIALAAVERAIADAGLRPRDVDGLMISRFQGDQLTAEAFHAHFGTRHDLWVSEAGGGMVWAGSAPFRKYDTDFPSPRRKPGSSFSGFRLAPE